MNDLKYSKASEILAPFIDLPSFSGELFTTETQGRDYSLTIETLHGIYEPQHNVTHGHMTLKPVSLELTTQYCTLHNNTKSNSSSSLSLLHLEDLFPQFTTLELDTLLNTQKNAIATTCQLDNKKAICNTLLLSHTLEENNTAFSQTISDFNRQINADKTLSAVALETYDTIYSHYPVIQAEYPCKTLNQEVQQSLSTIILSQTYSSNPLKTEHLIQDALKTYGQFSYTTDIIKALSINIAMGDAYSTVPSNGLFVSNDAIYTYSLTEPLKIVHQKNIDLAQHSIGGTYSPTYNIITVLEKEPAQDKLFSSTFIHESSHYVINSLFKNQSKPYKESDQNQQNNYKEAELAVFKHLAIKLGLTSSVLDSLNQVDEVIEEIKNNTIIDLVAYFSSPSKSTDSAFIHEMRNKYSFDLFNEYLPEKLLDVTLGMKLIGSIFSLKNASSDSITDTLNILGKFTSLIYDYSKEELSIELIVRIPDLLANDVSLSTLESYFSPLMNYWDNNISSEIEKLHETHQELCQGTNTYVPSAESSTHYCIDPLSYQPVYT